MLLKVVRGLPSVCNPGQRTFKGYSYETPRVRNPHNVIVGNSHSREPLVPLSIQRDLKAVSRPKVDCFLEIETFELKDTASVTLSFHAAAHCALGQQATQKVRRKKHRGQHNAYPK